MGVPVHYQPPISHAQITSNGFHLNTCSTTTQLPNYLFVYGSSRPDAPNSSLPMLGFSCKRAWLLGSRLYSFSEGGIIRAAVQLDESGNSVIGFAVSADESMGIAAVLDEFERREYSPEFYEKNIVQVITERGDRLLSYIYHRRELNPTNIIPSGDWFLQ